MPEISVLRLEHRVGRDSRISSHVGLVARAFGAKEIIFSGEHDEKMIESIEDVSKRWGGKFSVKYEKNWKTAVRKFKGIVCHLTMYGLPIEKKINEIRKKILIAKNNSKTKNKNILIIVGGAKVPFEIYQLSDYNISVTTQPHSEVAALAVFMHELFKGRELKLKFRGAKLQVVPQSKGKLVKSHN